MASVSGTHSLFLPNKVIQEEMLFWERCFWAAPQPGLEAMGTDRNKGGSSEHQETLFQCEGDHAVAQSAQGSGAEAILRSNLFGVLATWL